jgi:hypothetical protein
VVIVTLTVPKVNTTTACHTAGALALRALWWLVALRAKLDVGTAGQPDAARVPAGAEVAGAAARAS